MTIAEVHPETTTAAVPNASTTMKALVYSFSEEIQSAAREPLDASALIYALLLSPDEALRTEQLTGLARRGSRRGSAKRPPLSGPESRPSPRARLPLAKLALPALRHLRPGCRRSSGAERTKIMGTLHYGFERRFADTTFEQTVEKVTRRRSSGPLPE